MKGSKKQGFFSKITAMFHYPHLLLGAQMRSLLISWRARGLQENCLDQPKPRPEYDKASEKIPQKHGGLDWKFAEVIDADGFIDNRDGKIER